MSNEVTGMHSEQHLQSSMSAYDPEFRSSSPDSLMTNSLYRATATIDELTATLAKVSRTPSSGPGPDGSETSLMSCCCGSADCDKLAAWAAFQAKLENRVILCAEVGQALLEKHEAYVRRHTMGDDDSDTQSGGSSSSRPETPTLHAAQHDSVILAELRERNQSLEKRLHTALVDAEVADNGKKALIEELDEAKATLSKLAVTQARSAGWEARLLASEQDRDDLKQELDAERQRSRTAEAQVNSLKDICEKLHSDMNRILEETNQQRQTRTELSEEILRDARARLEMVQQQRFGHNVVAECPEVTDVMESLVADNEALKRDVAELQNYLTDSREEVRMLREEVEESRMNAVTSTSKAPSVSSRPRHNHAQSWASSFGRAPLSPPLRSGSVSSQSQTYEPLTPNTQARPLSPESQHDAQLPSISSPNPSYPPKQPNFDAGVKSRATTPDALGLGGKSPRRPLLLLTQSRGVQTDDLQWSSLFGSVFRPRLDDGSSSSATQSGEVHSESSSLADTQAHASTIAALVDKTSKLFTRMSQADALTLTNRLKRQRLAGDVSHLSHSTVSSILAEANGLRSHFRAVLEDERAISTCTRRDLRALLSLFREMFIELGQMRVALNDVILDPSLAPKLREVAMDPTKGLDSAVRSNKNGPQGINSSGWMAPLSKFFGGVVAAQGESSNPERPGLGTTRKASVPVSAAVENHLHSKPSKFVPKSGPALAASTATVNVEFSGSGVGRSTISNIPHSPRILSSQPELEDKMERSKTPVARSTIGVAGTASSRAVMDIFAGAPKPPQAGADPWVILPSSSPSGPSIPRPRKQQSVMDMRNATLTRSSGRWAAATEGGAHRLPRNVDAVVDVDSTSAILDDDEEEDMPNLLERQLRPRGLSDSSIRSSTLVDVPSPASEAADGNAPPPTPVSPAPPRVKRNSIRMTGANSIRQGPWTGAAVTRTSVFQAFSRAFTIPSAFSSAPPVASSPAPSTGPQPKPTTGHSRSPSDTRTRLTPTLSSSPSSAPTPALPTSRRPNLLPSLAILAGFDADETAEFVGSVRREHAFEEELSPNRSRAWYMDMDMPGRDL